MARWSIILLFLFMTLLIHLAESRPGNNCKPSGHLSPKHGKKCKDCCKAGKSYPQFRCSPPVTKSTRATLTVNGFQKGQEGGGASSCDGKYHKNSEMIVALSTGWFDKKKRCGKMVRITGNGKTVTAKVVDECDSVNGCDDVHGFQPPCPADIVDGSPAVWKALGVPTKSDKYGFMDVTWTDA